MSCSKYRIERTPGNFVYIVGRYANVLQYSKSVKVVLRCMQTTMERLFNLLDRDGKHPPLDLAGFNSCFENCTRTASSLRGETLATLVQLVKNEPNASKVVCFERQTRRPSPTSISFWVLKIKARDRVWVCFSLSLF